ncbi:ribosomal protein S18-alanine N-acetyltransferase [Bifidobacterium sp.]|jgi:ribosomal-protein-alanine N-acetyltransferase|uniref:ribosomal protein S18-alanine N-acetyltransferase n=1 Tax=Bifidobacterium sp. TaxID=41200 RepID=UPI0025C3BE1B|nr:ribosomal protein S18-alanine N-acetyltransferase [Bifidobacterium sp.]MCH4208597.1 ribosomal protein S18-alanine N-acetyltransferase [Bifidobacterium sp.]MCI1224283.1 ribosomal protein S18-alanine N-acetyltransferase [Bifidobacterium sp.]
MIVGIDTFERGSVVIRIARMERELFGRGAWSEETVREELSAPARTYVVDIPDAAAPVMLTEADKAAPATPPIRGYAGYWYDGDDAELMTIGVGEAYRRKGIANGMLRRLIDDARAHGARRMLLEVRVDNEPALSLYHRFGFTRLGLRRRYYQPENVDAYTMSLDLRPHIVGFRTEHAEYMNADGIRANMPDSHGTAERAMAKNGINTQ